MWNIDYFRQHGDALLRLSRAVGDPEVSARLQEMADEIRILVSVAQVAGLAADFDRTARPSLASSPAEVVPFKTKEGRSARRQIGERDVRHLSGRLP
jgi:hypothetical protein